MAALTTTFAPAPSCTADFYTEGIYYSIGGPSPSQCFPSGWASLSQYFSPGVCPEGYTQACSKMVVTGGTKIETQATCCPTGFDCYLPTVFNFPGQACVSIFPYNSTKIVTSITALSQSVTTMLITATLHSSTEAVNGYGVSIRYQSTDFASSTSMPSSTISSSSISSSSSSSISPNPVSSSASTPSPAAAVATSTQTPGISSGAKAGIGAAVGIIALVLLITLIVLFARRRARRSRDVNELPKYSSSMGEFPLPPPPPPPPATREVMKNGVGVQSERWTGEVVPPKKDRHELYTMPAELGSGVPARKEL